MINMKKGFIPLKGKLLLKRLKKNDIKGGIIMPETHEGKQLCYEVISASPKDPEFFLGQEVIAPPDGGVEVEVETLGKCEIIETRRIMAMYS